MSPAREPFPSYKEAHSWASLLTPIIPCPAHLSTLPSHPASSGIRIGVWPWSSIASAPCGSFLEVEDQLWLRRTVANCGDEDNRGVMWSRGNRVVMSSRYWQLTSCQASHQAPHILSLALTLQISKCSVPHFSDKEAGTQRRQVTCLRSHSQETVEQGFRSRTVCH